jgi:hypothetical protein
MSESRPNHDADYRWFLVGIAALTLVGGALRFTGLGVRDFWFDESCTFIYVHHLFDWPADSNLLVESTNLPYYIALRGWAALFGDSEAGYRSMSALAATLVIMVLGLLGRGIAGPTAGIVCAAVVAFHPLHIYYAHEARAYALWTLALSFALWLLFEASRRARARWWVAYGLVLLACLHLHYFTLYWVAASFVCIWLADNRRRVLQQWLVTTFAVGFGFLPYFFGAVWPAARGGGSAWITGSWEPIVAIPHTLWAFAPAGRYAAHLHGLSLLSTDTVNTQPALLVAAARTIPAIVLLAVFLLLARRLARQATAAPQRPNLWPAHIFAGGLTLLPLAIAWLYSVLIRPNYLVGRYDLVAWPSCMVWIGLGIAHFSRFAAPKRRAWAAAAICAPLLACSLVPITRMAALKPPPTVHNRRAQRLAELTSPGDLVITFSYDRDHLQYYLHQAGSQGQIVSYPSWLQSQIGWVDTEADLAPERGAAFDRDTALQLELIESVAARGGQVFLLADSLDPEGTGPRAAINRRLLKATAEAGYEGQSVDSNLLILRLRRASKP